MKKSILPVLAILILILLFYFMWPEKAQGPVSDNINQMQSDEELIKEGDMNLSAPGVLPDDQIDNKIAIMETAKGSVIIELKSKDAPLTVSNFVYLVQNAFYDGLTFHRVEPGFVIQGGDPNGNGTGGPGYKFDDEEVAGNYEKGSVAMANSGPNTNGSQFFICLDDLPDLPKNYNLFGKVTSGMDLVESIEVGDEIKSIIIEDKR